MRWPQSNLVQSYDLQTAHEGLPGKSRLGKAQPGMPAHVLQLVSKSCKNNIEFLDPSYPTCMQGPRQKADKLTELLELLCVAHTS
jgi:hypothetical protein